MTTLQPLDQKLARNPLLRGLSPAERHEILGLVEVSHCPAHTTLIREGESARFLGFLLAGRCSVIKRNAAGHDHQLAVVDEGGVFGEMSFFHPAPHSASIETLTEVELCRLPRESYDVLLRVGSLAAYKMALNSISVLADRLRRMDEWTAELVEKTNQPAHHEEWRDFQAKLYTGWHF